jgi:hypothetical protein
MAYNARKAAQTIAFFAMKNGARPLDVVKAVKLVYLADRESVSRFGFPIQDEDRVSMKHGPVNSDTYAMINGEGDLAGSGWAEFLRDREDHRLSLANPAISSDDLDELSEADLDVLEATWGRFGGMRTWDLVAWTHDPENVPEWENPGSTSWLIPLEVMMGHLGVPNVAEQAATVRDFDRIDTIFRAL